MRKRYPEENDEIKGFRFHKRITKNTLYGIIWVQIPRI